MNPHSREFTNAKEYGVLLSHASEDTVPGLVLGPYANRDVAEIKALQITQYFEIMAKVNGAWQSWLGESPREVIHRRWM